MSGEATALRLLAPMERLAGVLFSRGHGVLILLGLFVAIWTVFQIIASWPVSLHPDALESFAWSRNPGAGYYKHPPLQGLMTALWFAVMPVADWSFHLLCQVNAALGLYFVYLIARRFLSSDRALLVVLLLMLTPFYQFNAQRFASNQTLLSIWPIATWCFLRAFETRTILWSVAAGVAAALAMLGKYFSIYLVLGFVVAALAHPQRLRYLESPSPWISMLAGIAVLVPHLRWLIGSSFQPFDYAVASSANLSLGAALRGTAEYLFGGVAYMVLPLAVYWLVARPVWQDLREALWPSDPQRRMLALIFYMALLAPMLVAPLLRTKLPPLWSMQTWFMLPILLLATAALSRRAAGLVAVAVVGLSAAMLLAALAFAWMRHVQGTSEGRAYYGEVVRAAERLWGEATPRPLTIVTGDLDLGAAATFYGTAHPDFVPRFELKYAPWVTAARMQREGFVIVCWTNDVSCVAAANARATRRDARKAELEVVPQFLGVPAPPRRALIVVVPPAN